MKWTSFCSKIHYTYRTVEDTQMNFKSGFIAIVGRPNVGKSTFMNRVIGQKVSIISDKAQTTRNKIQGILTKDDMQMIFIDTPGIHKPKHRLGDFMVKLAMNTLNEADAIIFMINAKEGYGKGDQFIIDKLQNVKTPIYLVINKVDLIHPDDLFPLIETYRQQCNFEEIVPISALNGNNINTLLDLLKKQLPIGPKYYTDDQITDHSERFIISELIREKALELTREEVPHALNVVIETIESRNENTQYIQATIICERKSQKGIIIGKQGNMLKKIGQEARKDIELFLGKKIYLELWVKVQKDWRNKQSLLNQYGFRSDQY